MSCNKKYLEKLMNDPFPRLKEDERIYLIVPFKAKQFAKMCHCGFDSEIKLWFAGCNNSNLCHLIRRYGIHERTTEQALKLCFSVLTDDEINSIQAEKSYKTFIESKE